MKVVDFAVTNPKAWTEYRISDNELRMCSFEDTTVIEEANKRERIDTTPQERTNKDSGWRHVARLPLTVYLKLCKDGIANDRKAFGRWLNDRDNSVWNLGSKL